MKYPKKRISLISEIGFMLDCNQLSNRSYDDFKRAMINDISRFIANNYRRRVK